MFLSVHLSRHPGKRTNQPDGWSFPPDLVCCLATRLRELRHCCPDGIHTSSNQERFHKELRERPLPTAATTVYLVHSDEGLIGLGEGTSMSDDELTVYVGHSPFEYIMDDSVGPLQIGFYDLMGLALGLPIARLLGPSRDTAPLAWWSHCFAPDVLQGEAKLALSRGYRVHKIKRRAHTDVVEQVAAMAEVTRTTTR